MNFFQRRDLYSYFTVNERFYILYTGKKKIENLEKKKHGVIEEIQKNYTIL